MSTAPGHIPATEKTKWGIGIRRAHHPTQTQNNIMGNDTRAQDGEETGARFVGALF